MPIYFEDMPAGSVRESAPYTLTREEMVAFARQYDPQPFHVDEAAAKTTIYGGLIGSGWLTVAVMMRLLWDTLLKDAASLGSPGSDEVRWLKPVRPGDTLRARFTVVEAIPSRSKPDRGVLRMLTEMLNQHDEVVMTQRGLGMFARRPAG
ncbi:MAG TPA: MaoC family dehydratase [Methylomirabilota bacterium]|nr:MaoC family dehydratase [Methylomirabilota bacterium]